MNILSLIQKAILAQWPHPIVLEDHKLLFYPVPKVASSSMKSYFIALEVGSQAFRTMDHNQIHAYNFKRVYHTRWNRVFKEYRKIAIIRDPFERLHSCYRDKILKSVVQTGVIFNGFERYNKLFKKELFFAEMSFGQFCKKISKLPDFLSDGHFRSQVTFLPKCLDYLIDMSYLDESMPEIVDNLGMPPWKLDESKANISQKIGSNEQIWTSSLKELVRQRFKRDVHLYSLLKGSPYAKQEALYYRN